MKRSIKKSVKRLVKKSVKRRSIKHSVKRLVKKSVKRRSIKRSVQKSVKRLVKKSVKRSSIKHSVKRSVKKSVKHAVKRSVKQSVQKSVKRAVKRSVKQSVQKSVKRAVKRSVKQSVKKSVKRAVKRSVKKSVKRAVKRSVKQSVQKSVKRAVKRSVKKSVKRAVKRSVKRSVKKSVEEVVFEINGPIDSVNKNLACFDYDWTLIKPKGGKTFPSNKDDWQWLRPNVPVILKELNTKGYSIYIFTTQTKLWKIDMIKESLSTLNIPIKVIIGFGKDNIIKKPNKKLFYDNIKTTAAKFNKKSFYTGDAAGRSSDWSDEDKKFAKNVDINFKIPEDIFPIELSKKQNNINYEKPEQEIIILIGYPSSGKSTFASDKFKFNLNYHIINGDLLKTLPKMIKEGIKFLDKGYSVIFDATNPKKENREKIIELAKKYKISVRCFVFNTSIEEAMEFNTKRLNETGKKIPKIAFYLFRKNYIKPTKEEGCDIVEI